MKFILLFFIICLPNSYAEETWKIASLEWGPYAAPERVNQGRSIQKLATLLKKENITLIVEYFPWKRAKRLVQTDSKYVGIFPAWPEDIFEGAIISPAVDWSEIAILKISDQEVIFESIDELFKKYSVGVVSTYTYPKIIEDAIKKYPHHVESALNESSLLKKLLLGRGDVAITDPNVMRYSATRAGISNINIKNLSVIMKKELVVAFSNNEENRIRLKLLTKLLQNNSAN